MLLQIKNMSLQIKNIYIQRHYIAVLHWRHNIRQNDVQWYMHTSLTTSLGTWQMHNILEITEVCRSVFETVLGTDLVLFRTTNICTIYALRRVERSFASSVQPWRTTVIQLSRTAGNSLMKMIFSGNSGKCLSKEISKILLIEKVNSSHFQWLGQILHFSVAGNVSNQKTVLRSQA